MAVKRYKNGMTQKQYLKYMNKVEYYNPKLQNGKSLEEVMLEYMNKFTWTESKFSYIEYDNKLDCFVSHIYGVRVYKAGKPKIEEVMRIAEDYDTISKNCYYVSWGMSCGFHVIYDRKNGYKSYWYEQQYETEFYLNPGVELDWKIYTQEILDMDELIKSDERIKYCSYIGNSWIDFIQYIRLYRKYPIAEMLMKLYLIRMINEKALKVISENKEFRTYLFNNREYLARDAVTFTTAYNAFKKKAMYAEDYVKSLKYRIEKGREIAFQNKEVYKQLLKYTTQEKIAEYLSKNNISKSSYADYIVACSWLKLDFNDTKVIFPKNFKQVHDEYIDAFDKYNAEKEKEKNKAKDKKILATALKYGFLEYSNGTYQVVTAKSKMDLINEGSALNHCVGKMEYDTRQIEGKSIICFIRKCENPTTPFVTAEVSLTDSFKIKQCYGKNNNLIKEVDEFTVEWIKNAKKIYKQLNTVESVA